MAITQTIATPNVTTVEFLELSNDILDSLVNGDASAFKDAKDTLADYLAGATDLDASQKAGIYSTFLQSSYGQINQQALNAALELLKTNAQFELDKWATEIAYNKGLSDMLKVDADTALSEAQALKVAQDTANGEEQQLVLRGQWLEMEAKLQKQWGYDNATVSDLLLNEPTLGTTTAGYQGSVDKQIIGYDKVNYKDLLKSTNESIALLSNAGADVGTWQVDTVKLLSELITDGKINIQLDQKDTADTADDESVANLGTVVDGIDIINPAP